ncbi:MAG TPA: right-handed parallel beta-helix repeat-containing protein [Desulfuromonadaceae bacterium]
MIRILLTGVAGLSLTAPALGEDSPPSKPVFSIKTPANTSQPAARPIPQPTIDKSDAPASGIERGLILTQADFSYQNATLSEDTTWRGSVLIRGSLVIAPQATLRIEPGTVVRFMRSAGQRQTPRLVVMGRLQCSGTVEKPVSFSSNYSGPMKGDWGGIFFITTDKRNQIEFCRIEGAETAIAGHFSTVTAKGVSITRAVTGIVARDSVVSLANLVISDCETGLDVHDSEIDLREGNLTENRRGISAQRSSLAISQLAIRASEQQGILAEDCRIRISNCELSANAVGAKLKGGEGQIFLTRFTKNSATGLHLSGARVKVQRCLFAENLADGIQMDDGRGVVLTSSFINNGGYNLINNGREDIIAVQNWWGSSNEETILAKLRGTGKDARFVEIAPWLAEKPAGMP